eukprot:842339-Prymnesium_polylepis.2
MGGGPFAVKDLDKLAHVVDQLEALIVLGVAHGMLAVLTRTAPVSAAAERVRDALCCDRRLQCASPAVLVREIALQPLGAQLESSADLAPHMRCERVDELIKEHKVERAVLVARAAEARLGAKDLEAALGKEAKEGALIDSKLLGPVSALLLVLLPELGRRLLQALLALVRCAAVARLDLNILGRIGESVQLGGCLWLHAKRADCRRDNPLGAVLAGVQPRYQHLCTGSMGAAWGRAHPKAQGRTHNKACAVQRRNRRVWARGQQCGRGDSSRGRRARKARGAVGAHGSPQGRERPLPSQQQRAA